MGGKVLKIYSISYSIVVQFINFRKSLQDCNVGVSDGNKLKKDSGTRGIPSLPYHCDLVRHHHHHHQCLLESSMTGNLASPFLTPFQYSYPVSPLPRSSPTQPLLSLQYSPSPSFSHINTFPSTDSPYYLRPNSHVPCNLYTLLTSYLLLLLPSQPPSSPSLLLCGLLQIPLSVVFRRRLFTCR